MLFKLLVLIFVMANGKNDSEATQIDHKWNNVMGIENKIEMSETIMDEIRSMTVKIPLKIKAGVMKLPVKVYNVMTQQLRQFMYRSVRVASLAFLWTPTSDKFRGNMQFIVIDGRVQKQSHKRSDMLFFKEGKFDLTIAGKIMSIVSIDPNMQQFVAGSINVGFATEDIRKLSFVVKFDDTAMFETKSTVGFLDLSWKTVESTGGVYEECRWETFAFPLKLPPEVANNAGKTAFEKIRYHINKQYNDQKKRLLETSTMLASLEFGTDGGYMQSVNAYNKNLHETAKLIEDAKKRIVTVSLMKENEKFDKLRNELTTAMNSQDERLIAKAKIALEEATRDKNDMTGDVESDTGYMVVGGAD